MLLVVVGSLSRAGVSGGDVLALKLAASHAVRGGDVVVLTTADGRQPALEAGIPPNSVVATRSWSGLPLSVAYLLRAVPLFVLAARIVRRNGGRVRALTASPFPPDTLAALGAVSAGAQWTLSWQLAIPRPSVRYEHALDHGSRRIPRYGQLMSYVSQTATLALAWRLDATVLVANDEMAEAAARAGIHPGRVVTAVYGVDRAVSAAGATAPEASGASVVFLGRFHHQKGLEDLAPVWRVVLDRCPSARLAIVGGGNARAEERVRAAFSGFSESVSFTGVLTGADKYGVLRSAKVFVFPSRYESWGHVVLEAMACGLAVVGYDLPSSRAAFGDAVLYVPLGDVQAFGQAVAALLGDEGARAEFVAKSRAVAARHEWDVVGHRMLEEIDAASRAPRAFGSSVS
jgi:glycosyltransferase involved in cell wall biosynthesis